MSHYIGLSILSNNGKKTAGHKLLRDEARRILSCFADRPLAKDDIATDDRGRPYLVNGDVDFNISHSGNLAAVSLVSGGNQATGCDVERIRPRVNAKKIADDFFYGPENNYIFSNGRFDETRFFQIWTLKECFLKLRGLSVFDMAGSPSFICGEGPRRGQFALDAPEISSPLSFYLYRLTGLGEQYILAAGFEGTELKQPEIRWFSQSFLDCHSVAEITAGLPNS